MTQPRIRRAFEAPLKTWADAQDPVVRVAWQNTTFTPTAATYIRAFLLPASTISLDLLGKHRGYRGIFQLNLCMPLGNGMGDAEAMAEEIAALYPVNVASVVDGLRVYVVSPLSAVSAMAGDDSITVPLSCRYEAHDVTA